jgi:hypothetical protein
VHVYCRERFEEAMIWTITPLYLSMPCEGQHHLHSHLMRPPVNAYGMEDLDEEDPVLTITKTTTHVYLF